MRQTPSTRQSSHGRVGPGDTDAQDRCAHWVLGARSDPKGGRERTIETSAPRARGSWTDSRSVLGSRFDELGPTTVKFIQVDQTARSKKVVAGCRGNPGCGQVAVVVDGVRRPAAVMAM